MQQGAAPISAEMVPPEPLSLLVRRLQNFSGRVVRKALADCIICQKHFETDQPIWADRGDLAHVFVVEQGFAYKFEILPDGQRHIADFYGPGAICNWSRLNAFEEQDDIVFKARTTVTLLDANRLAALFENRPGVASLIKRHELARAMRMTQRIRALISRSASEKLLTVLLDLVDEYASAGIASDWLTLPLTQQELADILGVTSVHVSRTFSRLEEQGVLERQKRSVKLANTSEARLALAYRGFFSSVSQKEFEP